MIALTDLRRSFDGGATWAVDGVTIEIAAGELVVLLGESGCGKTTTLKMINRLVEPGGGRVTIDGADAAGVDPVELRRRIGYVFQGVGLFPHLTVAENVAMVPRLLRWPAARTRGRVDELLELVGLAPAEYRERRPHELSGGQRQRVGLARALAARPGIMLMDEPLGALDPLTRDALQDEFRSIHDQQGLTTVMVTHDVTEALLMADRIAVMRAGRITRTGTPRELLDDPGDDDVRRLMQMPRRQARRVDELLGTRADGSANDSGGGRP